MLWFDVGNGRYTTVEKSFSNRFTLWFDVGNGRYTTNIVGQLLVASCGLM